MSNTLAYFWTRIEYELGQILPQGYLKAIANRNSRVRAMYMEIARQGKLTFDLKKDKDGWMAQCVEIPGIMTYSDDPNLSDEEQEALMIEAVFVAFRVPPYLYKHVDEVSFASQNSLAFVRASK